MEGADHVAGQLRGDKECPFSGVTKSGRVWRKVPESDARRPVRVAAKVVIRHEPAFFCSSLAESEPVEKVQIEAQKGCVFFLCFFFFFFCHT